MDDTWTPFDGPPHDGLACTRCCQLLPVDLADRENLADYSVLCTPACAALTALTEQEEE